MSFIYFASNLQPEIIHLHSVLRNANKRDVPTVEISVFRLWPGDDFSLRNNISILSMPKYSNTNNDIIILSKHKPCLPMPMPKNMPTESKQLEKDKHEQEANAIALNTFSKSSYLNYFRQFLLEFLN